MAPGRACIERPPLLDERAEAPGQALGDLEAVGVGGERRCAVVDLGEAEPPRQHALAVTEQVSDRFHEEGEQRQQRPEAGLGLGLGALSHELEDRRLLVEALGPGDQADAAGAQRFGELDPGAAVEDPEGAVGVLDQPPQRERRALGLQERDVGVVAVEGLQRLVREPDAEELGRVLDRHRERHALGDAAEEAHQLGLSGARDRRRLQHQPARPVLGRGAGEGHLALDGGLGDGDRERQPAVQGLGDPVEEPAALGQRELARLAGQAERGDAMGAVAHHGLDLKPQGLPIEPLGAVEEGVEHGIDAGDVRDVRGHGGLLLPAHRCSSSARKAHPIAPVQILFPNHAAVAAKTPTCISCILFMRSKVNTHYRQPLYSRVCPRHLIRMLLQLAYEPREIE